jgi:hypothetical protein
MSGTLHVDPGTFICLASVRKYFVVRQQCIGSQLLHFHANTEHVYIVDSYMYVNNNKRECIVAFPWQQSLRKSSTMLPYTYIVYLFNLLPSVRSIWRLHKRTAISWKIRDNLMTCMAVPWLRWLVAGLSPRRPGFDPESVHVGFVVDKVALGQVFPPSTSVFPPSISFYGCSITWKNEKNTNHLHHSIAQ